MPAKKPTKKKKTTAKKTTAKKTVKKKVVKKAATKKRATTKRAPKKVARKTTAKRKSTAAKRKTTSAKRKTTRTAKTVAKKPALSIVKGPISLKKAPTKTQLQTIIAERCGLSKKEVAAVFEQLELVVAAAVKKGGAGSITIPGLVKFRRARKAARKARKGINPFTGEPMIIKARPATDVMRATLLKNAKEMV